MGVSFGKWLFLLSLATFAASAVSADEISKEEVKRRAAALAGKELAEAFPVLAETMESCEEKSNVIQIPHSNDIGVSRRALLLGVGYFNLKTQNECLGPAARKFFLAARVFERSELDEMEREELKDALQFVEIVLESWWRELKAKARYQAEVSEDDRARIESIAGLHQPFDMIGSWNASGN